MKKIIALAALAAATSAFAACSYTAPDTAWVYKWKFTGKTTFGVKPATVKAKPTSGLCGYTGNAPTCSVGANCETVRAPASLKIEGYTWYCKPGCGSDQFENWGEVNEIFWQKKPFKAAIAGGVSTDISHIIGKKQKQYEAYGVAHFEEYINGCTKEGTYTLAYAGLGKYDLKNCRVKSVKGNFAGYLDQPHYISKDKCVNAGYWICDCNNNVLGCMAPSVAFGKWSAKYQKSASKKFLKKGTLPKVASWADWSLNGTK